MLRWLFMLSSLFVLHLEAKSCRPYIQEVRRYHGFYFGIDYPYHYGVSQLLVESRCRNVISLDGVGSEGLAQITFRWHKKDLFTQGIYHLRTTKNQLKAQAFIMYKEYKRARCKRLWVVYQRYNGGGLVDKEIKRAGVCEHDTAKLFCRRKVIYFKNGTHRSACDINYKYSEHIKLYADRYYRVFNDSKGWMFW